MTDHRNKNRRSISVTGELHGRLVTYCEVNDRTISGFVENTLRQFVGLDPHREQKRRG